MRIVIVEDERPALEKLRAALRQVAPDGRIVAELSSVAEALDWLGRSPEPDLVFMDIQLSDGRCFDILRAHALSCPVIFATAFDEFLLEAFETNGIDYLLKPIRRERLAAAIEKYRNLREHFAADHRALLTALDRQGAHRQRVLVRKGLDYIPIEARSIAYIFTSDKLVFLVTDAGVRYMLDRPIAEMESELDRGRFFRANRAWLVSVEAIVRCRPWGKGKLLLDLRPPVEAEVVVAQERAATFRAWLGS